MAGQRPLAQECGETLTPARLTTLTQPQLAASFPSATAVMSPARCDDLHRLQLRQRLEQRQQTPEKGIVIGHFQLLIAETLTPARLTTLTQPQLAASFPSATAVMSPARWARVTGCSSGSVWNSASRRQKRVSLSDISSSL
jgi:hypothetical protein